jgi:multisubunit Na+/H+ antiporter MnhB subunit
MSYWRFAAMIATSTVLMYGLMYLNTYSVDHVFFSQTRVWMALLMGAAMAVVMLLFMRGMYGNKRLNAAIFTGGYSPSAFIWCAARPWSARSPIWRR